MHAENKCIYINISHSVKNSFTQAQISDYSIKSYSHNTTLTLNILQLTIDLSHWLLLLFAFFLLLLFVIIIILHCSMSAYM